jgi:hypothetical protein
MCFQLETPTAHCVPKNRNEGVAPASASTQTGLQGGGCVTRRPKGALRLMQGSKTWISLMISRRPLQK